MLIKFTDDKSLFMIMETKEDHDWFNNPKTSRIGISIIVSNHINDASEEFYKEHFGGQLWHYFKK